MASPSFVVVDVETTGLSEYLHRLTEVAMLRSEGGEIVDRFSTLINPEVHIPSFITRLTGISDAMVKGAPKVDDVMPQVRRFLRKDSVMVGHNVSFDHRFLDHNSERCGFGGIENPQLCTCKLSRRVFHGLGSYRLSSLCSGFGISSPSFHRAEVDLDATHSLLAKILDRCQKSGVADVDEVMKLQHMPTKRAYKKLYGVLPGESFRGGGTG